jgi:hypothetical protein
VMDRVMNPHMPSGETTFRYFCHVNLQIDSEFVEAYRFADPRRFNADLDPSFHFSADQYPTFQKDFSYCIFLAGKSVLATPLQCLDLNPENFCTAARRAISIATMLVSLDNCLILKVK